jgi:hypothetical protein
LIAVALIAFDRMAAIEETQIENRILQIAGYSSDPAQTQNSEGVYKATNVVGEPILRATARSERSGWYVSATVPLSYFKEPRLRGYSFAVLLLGTAIGLGWNFAYFFARPMARPLDEATRAAAAVGQGNSVMPVRTSPVEANLLLDTLAKAPSCPCKVWREPSCRGAQTTH